MITKARWRSGVRVPSESPTGLLTRENQDNHDIKPVWCKDVKHCANKGASFNRKVINLGGFGVRSMVKVGDTGEHTLPFEMPGAKNNKADPLE